MIKSIVLPLLILLSLPVLSQNFSFKRDASGNKIPGSGYSLPFFKMCSGPVQITAAGCGGASACQVTIPGATPHTFSDQDLIDLTVQGLNTITIRKGTAPAEFIEIEVFPAISPAFDLYTCNNRQIDVKLTDTNYPEYAIDFHDATAEVITTGGTDNYHTYAVANNGQQVTVRGNYHNCPLNTKTIDVIGAATPARDITLLTLTDDNTLLLELEQGPQFNNVQYAISGVAPTAVFNENQKIISVATPDNQIYCIQLSTNNPCPVNPPVAGNRICSIPFTLIAQYDNRMELDWQADVTSMTSFTILKNDVALTPDQPTGGAAHQFIDNSVNCPNTYTYQVAANYPGGYRSLSKKRSQAAVSKIPPPAIDEISSAVNGSSVSLSWSQDPLYTPTEYTVARTSSNAVAGTSTTQQFTVTPFDIRAAECYRIAYEDACGNSSNTSTVVSCPIELAAKLANDNSADITWTAYEGWKGDANNVDHYTLERYDESGALISSDDFPANSTFTNDAESEILSQTVIYKIVAHPVNTLLAPSVSNTVRIIRSNRIAYPDAFVPGSSIPENATFKVIARAEYSASFELQVYNRWGELMFRTTDIHEGWDGTYKGNKMPEGTYVFIARFIDEAGRILKHSGNVVLLRK